MADPTKLGAYVHVPFCASRCGYCDFNTYTAAELGAAPSAAQRTYLDALSAEIARAAESGDPRPLSTVFFGGGTPTLLCPADLAGVLAALRTGFGLVPEAEVTVEANPDSVDPAVLEELVAAGFTRLSLGMQSAVPGVLDILDRNHTPGRAVAAVGWARAAGFTSVSLDLIYGAPGESLGDWRRTLEVALAADPDHLSAYSLIIEDGTPLARRLARGEFTAATSDELADKYLIADEACAAAGLRWYEVSNWARAGHACRHNLGYWHSADWWGFGPGAHSHLDGVRRWNVKHPLSYARRVHSGESATEGEETLTPAERHTERVLLELRLSSGLPLDTLTGSERARVPELVTEELAELTPDLVLTRRGRLLADAIIANLLD